MVKLMDEDPHKLLTESERRYGQLRAEVMHLMEGVSKMLARHDRDTGMTDWNEKFAEKLKTKKKE